MNIRSAGLIRQLCLLALVLTLCACQNGVTGAAKQPVPAAKSVSSGPEHLTFSAPAGWGGEVRCMVDGCKLALVEHEEGQLVLHQFKGRAVVELDRQPLAYHPDSAKWLTDDWVVAAVERDHALDLFNVKDGRLAKQHQIVVGFPPRDVVVIGSSGDDFTLLATPYSGKNIAVAKWTLGSKSAKVTAVHWCEAPWHPANVARAPGGRGEGVVVACLDDKKLLYASAKDWTAAPAELARFEAVARQARPTPSGKWVYVALETGGKNARVDMDSGELQYLTGFPSGSVSVAPMADDLVIWGESNSIYLQRIDAAGAILDTRWLRVSGFPTQLQLIDIDGDGERDLMILNSAGKLADVYFGPLWERALEKL